MAGQSSEYKPLLNSEGFLFFVKAFWANFAQNTLLTSDLKIVLRTS
jgi:hypothetical protein